MSFRFVLLIFAVLGLPFEGSSQPIVQGFERFHKNAPSADGGRLLYNELGCANCHGGDTGLPARRGPRLEGVTQRARIEWLEAFLLDPSGSYPGATMPALLQGKSPSDARAVLQYISSLKQSASTQLKSSMHVNPARGAEIFHSVGCVACHAPRPDFVTLDGARSFQNPSNESVPLPDLRKKTNLTVLADFLLNPLKTSPAGRMPKIALSKDDAVDIAGYLMAFEFSDGRLSPPIAPVQTAPDLVERGRILVTEARCAACHELPKEVAASLVPLKNVSGGCLKEQPNEGVPDFHLSASQRESLREFLRRMSEPVGDRQIANLTLQALNCVACHERDALGGPDEGRKTYFLGDENLGDTGRYPPPLTGVGRKLRGEWLAKVLMGEVSVRPYLKTRMPVFGASVSELGPLLLRADSKASSPLPGGDDTAGRQLLGTHGGLGCITCHRWGDKPSLGIQALDISNIGQRLQPEWFSEYLRDPAAYRPGTLMPSFWPGGKSANATILEGDPGRQIASLYSFAKSGNGEPEGFPQTQNGEFELLPRDRPIVQRTFLEDVGTQAILVGFPDGVHLAFDGRAARPALAWKGRFFDAYNTWFSRFAPFEKPLGTSVVRWPTSEQGPPALRFSGYRLDEAGVPTFLYSVAGINAEERFEAVAGGLKRKIKWSGTAPLNFPVEHPVGVSVEEEPQTNPSIRTFIYLWP
jgi:cytochrome c553